MNGYSVLSPSPSPSAPSPLWVHVVCVCVCTCVHMYVYVLMPACMCIHVCILVDTCMWKPEVGVRYPPAYLGTQSSPIQLDWLASDSRDPLVSTSPVLGLQASTAMLGFVCECWRSECESSCLQSKHLTN